MPHYDELCRLPLLRTHFPAVNPLLSDTIYLGNRSKSNTSTICAHSFYAGKLICSVSCGEYAGNSFVPVALQQCIPVGRHAIPWYGGLVRNAKSLHILFRLSQFCFCWPFLSVKQLALSIYPNTIIGKSP